MPLDTGFKPGRRERLAVRPPWLRDGSGDGPAGIEILFEIEDDLGLVLWSVHRFLNASLLNPPSPHRAVPDGVPRRVRSRSNLRLWKEARDATPALAGSLTLIDQLREGSPGVSQRDAAEACERIAKWATLEDHRATAAFFAESAAHLALEDPGLANSAARACRDAVLYHRSELWYLRARSLAKRHRSLTELIRAMLGLGGLMHHLGNHTTARAYFLEAKRRAERRNRLRQAAEADHDLLLLAAETGDYSAGEFHAAEALRLYPLSHPRIPYLVHDWAYFLTRLRIYAPAVPLLKTLAERLAPGADQVYAWSTVARAAAGARRMELYADACRRVRGAIDRRSQLGAYAYHNLACAAWSAAAWNDARTLASMSIEVARARGEQGVCASSADIRRSVIARIPAPPEVEPPPRNMIEALHRRCITGLRRWKPRSSDAGTIS